MRVLFRSEVARRQMVALLPAVDAREVEDALDEPRQAIALAHDDLAVGLPLLLREPAAVLQRLTVEADEGQRCLQLVRDAAHEVGLALARVLETHVRLDEALRPLLDLGLELFLAGLEAPHPE